MHHQTFRSSLMWPCWYDLLWTRLVGDYTWCLCLYSVISIMEYYWLGNTRISPHSRSTSEGPTRWTSRWRWVARGPVWWRWWACPGRGPPGGTAGIPARCSTPPWSRLCWPGFRPTRKSETSTKESATQLRNKNFFCAFLYSQMLDTQTHKALY